VRSWERALRRVGLPVAWTHGYTPWIRLSFAAALSLGAVGKCELADEFLTEPVGEDDVQARLGAQLPGGCGLLDAVELPVRAPSLSSQVAWAWYEVPA
jgi:radical SAM-linked protein